MEEKFKDLNDRKEPPKEVKDEVFKTLDSMQLMADILDLFTFKFIETEVSMIENIVREENTNQNDTDKTNQQE